MFTGVFGLIGLFKDPISSLLPMAGDTLAALLFVTGGIAWAIGMRNMPCDRIYGWDHYLNPLLNQGCLPYTVELKRKRRVPWCGILHGIIPEYEKNHEDDWVIAWKTVWNKVLRSVYQKAYANVTIQFLGSVISVILIGLGFLMFKKKGGKLRTDF